MTVIVSKRKESKLEPVYNAVKIKDAMIEFCIRSFGVRDINHIVRQKYELGYEKNENPQKYMFYMAESKRHLISLTDRLIEHTRAANRVRMTDIRRCDLRLDYLDQASCDCEMIIAKLQNIVDIFMVDLNKLKPYMKLIDTEISLLKNWISYTNKVKRGMI